MGTALTESGMVTIAASAFNDLSAQGGFPALCALRVAPPLPRVGPRRTVPVAAPLSTLA
jgi:hypothetical protein